ncbi:MAG TPA: hypothetical protein VM884_08410 [Flavisolibacter sp.]|jgi:threonine/homoserine/homoserine lactone efflux protein|nr:hypothetical protein [Flavisolibacter sp.]
MIEDFQNKQKKQGGQMRSIMDYTMGFIFFCFGVFFIIYRQFGIRIADRDPSALDYVIGAVFVLYGGWRMYRGYKKNYN